MIRNDLFKDVEQALRPVIVSHALRLSRAVGLQVEDAIQEHRVALAKAMEGYDYNRSHGGLHRFADRVLRNNTLSLIYRYTTETRMPHTVCEIDGEQKVVKWRLASLDESNDDGVPTVPPPENQDGDPESLLIAREAHERRRRLLMRLYNTLTARERLVFDCKCRPGDAFLTYLRNVGVDEPTHPIIAKYIGLGKNAVDYAAHHIRDKFTRLAEQEFPDLIEQHIIDGTWPMIHQAITTKPDHEFASRVIRERSLEPRPHKARDIRVNGEWGFEMESYPWGVVLYLKNADDFHTLVVEGRFNVLLGSVFGKAEGTHKSIVEMVPWYPKLVKAVRAGR